MGNLDTDIEGLFSPPNRRPPPKEVIAGILSYKRPESRMDCEGNEVPVEYFRVKRI